MSFPERQNQPSRTVTATKIGTSREALIFPSERCRKGDGEYRTATVREAATLMGFAITFQFLGYEGNKWMLAGNAVCPPVSRAFAKIIREKCEFEKIVQPYVMGLRGLEEVPNLNTFESKQFDNPPQRKKGSRFRRHPFKYGNLTVTLSNYDIEENAQSQGRWQTSVQYGTGEGFVIQKFSDGYFKNLEPIISTFEEGPTFIDTISNGFSEKIADSKLLQHIYESRCNEGKYIGPVELVETIAEIIEEIKMEDPIYDQGPLRLFPKRLVPKKQVMALYAITKICSIANGEKV
jgi:DNA (cytosine-5)-methyltransferase 1